jgi:hypothetical protein
MIAPFSIEFQDVVFVHLHVTSLMMQMCLYVNDRI